MQNVGITHFRLFLHWCQLLSFKTKTCMTTGQEVIKIKQRLNLKSCQRAKIDQPFAKNTKSKSFLRDCGDCHAKTKMSHGILKLEIHVKNGA